MDKYYIVISMAQVALLVEKKGPFTLTVQCTTDTARGRHDKIDFISACEPCFTEKLQPMMLTNVQPILGTENAMVEFSKLAQM